MIKSIKRISINKVLAFIIVFGICISVCIGIVYVVNPSLLQHVGAMRNKEGFDGLGMYVKPPLWFRKPAYDVKDWIVTTYPDKIQPSCLPYSIENKYNQDLGMLNYFSSAQQFWRF